MDRKQFIINKINNIPGPNADGDFPVGTHAKLRTIIKTLREEFKLPVNAFHKNNMELYRIAKRAVAVLSPKHTYTVLADMHIIQGDSNSYFPMKKEIDEIGNEPITFNNSVDIIKKFETVDMQNIDAEIEDNPDQVINGFTVRELMEIAVDNIRKYPRISLAIEPVVITFQAPKNREIVGAMAKKKLAEYTYNLARDIVMKTKYKKSYVGGLVLTDIRVRGGDREDIMDIRMYNAQSNVVKYDWANHVENLEGTSCVLSYFMNRFSTQKKFRNPNVRGEGMTLDRLLYVTQAKSAEDGISINQVRNICEYYRLPMLAFNIDGKILESYQPDTTNRALNKSATVAFVIADNHFYHVKPNNIKVFKREFKVKEEIKKTRRVAADAKEYIVDFREFNPNIKKIEHSKAIYKPLNELQDIFSDKNQHIKSIGYNNGLTHLTLNEKEEPVVYGLLFNDEESHKKIIDDYKSVGAIIPHNPNPINLGMQMMPDLSAIQNTYISFDAPMCKNDTYITEEEHTEYKKNYKKAVDIIRCYKNALKNDFIEVSVNAIPERYVGQTEPGYYYGRYSNSIIDLGYRWYPYVSGVNPLSDISYFIRALKVHRNPFDQFVKKSDKMNFSKQVANFTIGVLSRTTMKNSRVYRTTSFPQALNLFEKGYKLHAVKGVYYAVEIVEAPLLQNSKHIHDQILWRAFDNIMKLANQFEKVFSIRTDSIWGILPENYEINERLYRYEEKPHKWLDSNFNEKTYDDIFYVNALRYGEHKDITKTNIYDNEITEGSDMYKYLAEHDSFYCNARAGYGKTHLLNRVKSFYGDKKVLCISMYNVASHNLTNGQTLEHMLSRVRNYEHYYAIMIDECGVMSDSDFAYIYKIHKLYPNIRFMFFGDFMQLKPINQLEPIYNSRAFKEIIQGNELVLQINHRNDLDYNKEYFISDFQQAKGNTLTRKHICYFNKTRIHINEICMNQFAPSDTTKHDIKDGKYDTYIKLYDDLPLRFTKNIPSEHIFNGNIRLYKNVKDKFKLEDLLECVVPGYALTLYAIQGSTINEPYTIHDTNYIFSDYSMKYVAYSRTTKKDNVFISI